MENQNQLFHFLLGLGDDALILGHRLSEWCSKGPILEEDLALTNMALDNIGRAQSFLKYAGEVEGTGRTADDLAYKRGERQFRNHLLTELPNGNFAQTIARQLLFSSYEHLLFSKLTQSTDPIVAGIAEKSVKEVRYHFVHARDWCYRLGKGTALSHEKLQNAVDYLWAYTGELFENCIDEEDLVKAGITCPKSSLKSDWLQTVTEVLSAATINIPNVDFMHSGGAKGIHTEHLGHILAEMQYLPRAYPTAVW